MYTSEQTQIILETMENVSLSNNGFEAVPMLKHAENSWLAEALENAGFVVRGHMVYTRHGFDCIKKELPAPKSYSVGCTLLDKKTGDGFESKISKHEADNLF